MGPTLQSKPAAKPAVKRRTRTKKEVKLPVLNIRSPFCAEVIRPNPQTEVASKSFSKCRPQPHVSLTTAQAASSHVSSSSGSKEPQTPTTTRKSFHNGVSMSTRSCIQGVIGPTRQKSEDCNMKHRAKVVSSQGSTVEMNKHQ
ncbi:uncharacterized protein LOC143414952 isoform X2 [Maylandia zebra]|uniref:uncharacterized protein LOC143414952 isoform X2 n=1 Tax=Maylandia zebra TaxID=106582 RepID=UPI00403CC88E